MKTILIKIKLYNCTFITTTTISLRRTFYCAIIILFLSQAHQMQVKPNIFILTGGRKTLPFKFLCVYDMAIVFIKRNGKSVMVFTE